MRFLPFVFLFVPTLAMAQVPPPQPSKLVLTASEEVNAAPDQALVTLSVVSQSRTAGDALLENSQSMAKAIESLRASGIESKNIQTSSLSIQPQYAYNEGQAPRVTGYEARNTIALTVDDLSKLGSILDKAVTLGVNSIDGPHFKIKDSSVLEDEARLKAMAKVKARSALYEKGMGLKLGRILSVSENTTMPQPVMDYARPRAQVMEAKASAPTPVESGELRISAQVSVEWEIRP